MPYSDRSTRYRGSRKRFARIRITADDKWLGIFIAMLCLLAMVASAWLTANYHD